MEQKDLTCGFSSPLLTASSMSWKATTLVIVCQLSQALKQKLLCVHKEVMQLDIPWLN